MKGATLLQRLRENISRALPTTRSGKRQVGGCWRYEQCGYRSQDGRKKQVGAHNVELLAGQCHGDAETDYHRAICRAVSQATTMATITPAIHSPAHVHVHFV